MNLKFLQLLLMALTVWTCMSTQNVQKSNSFFSTDTVILHLQETYYNEQEKLMIKFDSLLTDSRCPVNAQCVWEGNARVLVTMDKNSDKSVFTLNTNRRFTRDTLLSGYSVNLAELKPYPHADSLYSEKDYSAKLIISKQ